MEIAAEYGKDLEIVLTEPNLEEYVLMYNERASADGENSFSRDNFDLGKVPNNGTLANTAPYVFVEKGGSLFRTPFSPSGAGPYNANSWLSSNHTEGQWTLLIAVSVL